MNFIQAVYIIILCVILPLYMRDGYYKLGEAKGIAFLWIASSFLIVNIVALLTMSVASKLKKPNGNASVHLSKTETLSFLKPRAFLLAFILTSLLSLAFSMDKKSPSSASTAGEPAL